MNSSAKQRIGAERSGVRQSRLGNGRAAVTGTVAQAGTTRTGEQI